MIGMNNLLIDLLHCQQQTQSDPRYVLHIIHLSQGDHP